MTYCGAPSKGALKLNSLRLEPQPALSWASSPRSRRKGTVFPEHPGVLLGVDQSVDKTLEALGADDVEVTGELLPGADASAEEVSEGQLDGAAVGEAPVELQAVLLAVAKGADELAHRDLSLAHLGGLHWAHHLAVALDDVALEHLPVGSTDHLGFLGSGLAGLDVVAGSLALGGQRVDRRQLQTLVFRAAEALAGGGGGNVEFLDQNVEGLDHQGPGFRLAAEQLSGGGTHFLQGHVGGRQGASLFEHIPKAAGVHRQDAGVASHHGIAHISQEPGHVAHGFTHPLRAVEGNADRAEARGKHDAHIRIGLETPENPAQEALAALPWATVATEAAKAT